MQQELTVVCKTGSISVSVCKFIIRSSVLPIAMHLSVQLIRLVQHRCHVLMQAMLTIANDFLIYSECVPRVVS